MDPIIELLKQSRGFHRNGSDPAKYPYFYQHVTSAVKNDGLWLEFGTGAGLSLNHLHPHVPETIYSFDWFNGLPENWIESNGKTHPAGTFWVQDKKALLKRLDRTLPKAVIIDGLFADTLPIFLDAHTENVAFVHVDCDLYSSTKTVLNCLGDRIVPGTVLLFDEFWGYENYAEHEYLAFAEFIGGTDLYFEFIAHVIDARQAALVIK
jgi:hypothetical protein